MPDLSEISTYAKVDNTAFRLVKNNTPGPYTFIFKATKEVPRRLMNEKKKTIGIRVPPTTSRWPCSRPSVSRCSPPPLILPGSEMAEFDPEEIADKLGKQLDLVVNGGYLGEQPTTVVDFSDDEPVLRAAVPGIRRRLSDLADPVPALTTPGTTGRLPFPAHRHRAGAALP